MSVRRATLGGFVALAAMVIMALPALAEGSEPAAQRFSIDASVRRADGSTVLLRIEVVAASEDAARSLSQDATGLLTAEASSVAGAPSVTAAWLPWSWKWSPSELPVPVAYNPTGAPSGVGPSSIIAGLQAWSSVPNSSFRYQYAGITENTATILDFGPDGENVISWGSLPCDRGCVLGITSKEAAHEVDMLLNNNPAAAEQLGIGDRLDWRTVILHELGHMAGLEHSCPAPFGPCTQAEADAVMYFQYRGLLRKLTPDDEAGIAALYPEVPAPSPTPAPPGLTPTPTPPYPEFPVVLEQGWNLVVLPIASPQQLADGLPCLEAIYTFENNAWLAWIRNLSPNLQHLTTIDPSRSYWAKATTACAKVFP
ncbi:MAG: matrixin family metalloprotease [Dehalococcoidia bacterium]